MAEKIDPFTFFLENLNKSSYFFFPIYLKQFGALETNLDRVNFVYKDLRRVCPNFPPYNKDEKDDNDAVRKRQEGNAHFKSGNYRKALDCYTASIAKAKSDSVLGMAYANRSAALFRLGLHQQCLVDIERALKHGYPDEFKSKLFKRQKDCKALKSLEWKYYQPAPTIPDSEKNPLIECARNCVQIVHKKQYGRCVVATRDIEVGEVLAVEEVYAAVIKDEFYTHCHECFELCYNLIPCEKCSKALYCSESCRDGAFASYHKYECPILLTLDSIMLDNPKRLALKMVFKAKDDLCESKDYNFEEKEVYRSNRFKEVFNMETHTKERSVQNLLARTSVAATLFHLIKTRTTFLQDGVDEDRLKEIILTILLVCSLNTVGIDELTKDLDLYYELTPFATAVYSFFTLFNHSCSSNVMRQFHGSLMVMRTFCSVKKGEQLFVTYGPTFDQYPKEFRQNFLAEHQFFTCTCQACEENWPMNSERMALSSVGQAESYLSMLRLSTTDDVDFARKELNSLKEKMKRAERTMRRGQDYSVRTALRKCYNIFGNKRIV